MAWSDQQNQMSQNLPQSTPPNPMPPAPGATGQTPYFGANPLQPSMAPQPPASNTPSQYPAMPPAQAMPAAATPLTQQQSASPALGQTPMGQMPQQGQMDDDKMDLDDVEWVKRTKRAIAATAGDPHRKVQLIQHLRSQYLKQRFGRTVRTDEG